MKANEVDLEASTIHRLLEVDRPGYDGEGWGFKRNAKFPLEQKFIVVDEASMLDIDLFASLLAACGNGTHLLLVGDPFQLPPVGHGAPLRDLIRAGVPNGELTEIRRNAGQIVHACKAIKDGAARLKTCDKINAEAGDNLRQLEAETPQEQVEALRAVLVAIKDKFDRDPIWDTQILVAVNAKSEVSRKTLNSHLQGVLNPDGHHATPNPFRIADKIICLKNSSMAVVREGGPGTNHLDAAAYAPEKDLINGDVKDVFLANGEIGKVVAVAPKLTIARFFTPDRLIKIPMGRQKDEEEEEEEGDAKGDGCNFSLAYAITVHKAQGSEWPFVIVMIDGSGGAMRICTREHVYTAISRGKYACILIGKLGVLDRQRMRVSLVKRKTFLCELLKS